MTHFRSSFLLLLCCAVPPALAQTPWPNPDWPVAAPDDRGLASAPLAALDSAFASGRFGAIDRFVVVKDGYLVIDEQYENDYETISEGHRGALGCGFESCEPGEEDNPYNYYHPSTHPYYQGRDVHSLQSVTKSVAATVIGVALTRGDLEDLNAPLLAFFGDYDLSRVDPRLHEATLDDLLTMRTGIEWHEQDRPFDSTNTTLQLEASEDWIQFTLNQPSDAAPGTQWVYNSGGSHLMSGVILDATGMTIDEYAAAHLFGPLGVDDLHWKMTPKGLPDTEGGLYLEARQLAKIGYLYLQGGRWKDQELLSEDFVTGATARQVDAVNGLGWGYGYQWWRLDRDGLDVWAGLGFGGQYLLILPAHDLIGVVNSWNIFGERLPNTRDALLNALIEAAGAPD